MFLVFYLHHLRSRNHHIFIIAIHLQSLLRFDNRINTQTVRKTAKVDNTCFVETATL